MGVKNLAFTNAYDAQFGNKNPQLAAYNQLVEAYGQVDNILIVIAPNKGDVFQTKIIYLVNELTDLAWQTPHSTRVDSLSNYTYTFADGEDLVSEPLLEMASNLNDEDIEIRANEALQEPSLRNALISADSLVTAVAINISLPRENLQAEVAETMGYINKTLLDLGSKYPEVTFRLSGKIAQDQAFFDASGADSAVLFPAVILIIFTVVLLMLRSLLGGIALVITVVACTAASLGVFGWKHILLTPETLSAAIMIMPLAIADCVHLFLTYAKSLSGGASRKEAVSHSISVNFKPILLTSLTTAIGFLSLTFASSPSFQLMGYMVAIGVFFAFVLSFTFFAPLMAILPIRRRENIFGAQASAVIGDLVENHHNKLLIGLVFLSMAMVYGASRNELNQNTAEYFSPEMTYRQNIEWIDTNLTGVNNIQFSISAAPAKKVTDPEYLNYLENFAQWLRQQDKVVNVTSFSDIMKKINKVMNDNDPTYYKVQQDAYISAQYLTLYELSLPYGMGLTNIVNFDKTASRLSVNLNISSNQEIIAFDKKAQNWLTTNAPDYMNANGVSADIMYAYQLEYNIPGIIKGLLISVFLIALVIMLALKSLRLGLISLIPNIVPILMAFGAWGYFNGQIGLAIALVMGMTLGIVVDDTVHFISKYHRARYELGLEYKLAIKHALDSVCSALLATTIALASGFLVLLFSNFTPNSDLGLLTAAIVVIALIFDLLFLPSLMLKTEKKHA